MKPNELIAESAKANILLLMVSAMMIAKPCSSSPVYDKGSGGLPDKDVPLVAEKLVRIKVTPAFKFNFVIMKQGVLQHLDRQYTYDVVPAELLTGLLFQGVHRPPKETEIEIELLAPAKIFFFFHHQVDGGYSEIFAKLKNWKRCAAAPQYDIRNGDHGLKMVMYQLEADAGTYVIPPTTTDRACFNIVFQAKE
jgi:hypothetical protein